MKEQATIVVMLGAPGTGKGTQAVLLAERLGIPHISTGDLFREHLAAETPLGIEAATYMNKGELVPDEITITMLNARLEEDDCENGVVLDGYPRTLVQALALESYLDSIDEELTMVANLAVPEVLIVKRLSGRWMSKSGNVYHAEYNPPKRKWFDDEDGSPLYQREDDKAETVLNRLKIYEAQTLPLIDHFREEGKLVEFNGVGEINDINDEIFEALQ
ncbi:MAG TPA: adenylate kinase [Anaerolineaceae bacterium]|nr:adenylate kinase [Anaerolineaceae bacterium]